MMMWSFGNPTCANQANCYSNASKDYCYSARIRSTVLQGLPFGGVPTVLALDFMCFLVLLFVFSILRKVAWDYGRLALVTDADSVASALHSETPDRYERLTSVSSSVEFEQRDNGFCSWLTAIFRIKDEEIREKCGEDAVHYLSFQRHIIGLLVVVGVLSVGIVLPVNFSGNLLDNNAYSFGRTTIANLNSGNNLLWLHTSFAFMYLLLTVYSMRRHTSKMHYKEDDLVKRTLFINGISKYAEESHIKQHFEQAYENCVVLEARVCYNVAKLMSLNAERSVLFCVVLQEEAVSYYTKLEAKLKEEYRKEKEKVNTKPLGMAFVTFQNEAMTAIILKDFNACQCQGCNCRQEPRSSQFSDSLHVSNWSVIYAPDPQNVRWENLSLGGVSWWIRCFIINCILFILLFFPHHFVLGQSSSPLWTQFKRHHSLWDYLNNPIITQFFPTLLLWAFSALLPTIVYYSAFFEAHWTRCVFLPDNGAFFVNYVIASAFISETPWICCGYPGLLMYHDPAGCLLTSPPRRRERLTVKLGFRSCLRRMMSFHRRYDVSITVQSRPLREISPRPFPISPFRKRTEQHQSEREETNHKMKRGVQGELRTDDQSVCGSRRLLRLSNPPPAYFTKAQGEGGHAAFEQLSLFFSHRAFCGGNTGLMYMLLKHLVDRYNMYYAYLPSKLDKKIHSGAVNQVVAAPILCLFWLLFFSTMRTGFLTPTSMFTFVVLIITIVVCLSHVCFGHFKYLSAHNYKVRVAVLQIDTKDTEIDGVENGRPARSSPSNKSQQQMYIAQVLQDPNSDETGAGSGRDPRSPQEMNQRPGTA
ncbi:CSC1-like protein 2 [Cyprinus carpio]|uniref:CSC1-like protein 2 n=1 Tax=Cyprinus carpio TaxID=7962 RepID=A0A9Q9YMF2_CYPCA|nr:CSC1-like protein 2 [Cyprinus carpio]